MEDDVWIGYDVLIMSGVKIGKGSVIGAKSIVTKSVPPYSVYVGNKVIKSRFSTALIDKIRHIDFKTINHIKQDSYQAYCQTQVNEDNIDTILMEFVK